MRASHRYTSTGDVVMIWTLEDRIEDLVAEAPEAIVFLMDFNIRCLACGEPVWGTLGDAMKQRGYTVDESEDLLDKLNHFLIDP